MMKPFALSLSKGWFDKLTTNGISRLKAGSPLAVAGGLYAGVRRLH